MLNKSILTCFHKRSIRGAVQHSAQQRQAAALQKVSRLAQLLMGNAAALYHKQGTVTYLGKAESVTAFAQAGASTKRYANFGAQLSTMRAKRGCSSSRAGRLVVPEAGTRQVPRISVW